MGAVRFGMRLSTEVAEGVPVLATLIFEHPTVRSIAAHLHAVANKDTRLVANHVDQLTSRILGLATDEHLCLALEHETMMME